MTGSGTNTGSTAADGPVKYARLLKNGGQYLKEHGIEECRTDAWLLFSFVTGMDRTAYLMRMDETVPEDTKKRYRQLLEKRGERIPLQQLTGTAPFMGFDFRVFEDVLIPRQDTETLAQEALAFIRRKEESGKHAGRRQHGRALSVLDLCTGSGCLAVSLKLLSPEICCTASDLSEKALAAAGENAKRLGAEVSFVHGSLFENIRGKFDLIVCNPPYIRRDVIETLDPEVRDHEPHMALDGGEDGLDFYRAITAAAPTHLEDGGALMFEIGSDEREAVAGLMREHGFHGIEAVKDLSGRDRAVKGFV